MPATPATKPFALWGLLDPCMLGPVDTPSRPSRVAGTGERLDVTSELQRGEGVGISGVLVPIGEGAVVSAVDAVSNSLRQAIAQGQLRPGTRLPHEAVGQSLGVSRQPVREALRQLHAEGFLVRTGSRGYVVREFTPAEVEETYYLRWLLESEAAYLAASGAHREHTKQMTLLNYGIKTALDLKHPEEVPRLNADFHKLVRQSCGLPLLTQLIDKIWNGITVLTPIFIPARGTKSVSEHAEIIAAIDAGDADTAREAMRHHIAEGASDYFHNKGIGQATLLGRLLEGKLREGQTVR